MSLSPTALVSWLISLVNFSFLFCKMVKVLFWVLPIVLSCLGLKGSYFL